ncbi:MAG TPA: HD domain-containing phosphohydrolase [Gemmatimonadaceae bacterium]|nr:HD domain-containing phosphohydrolase [Gemmatimonadaceae bacterium]
MVAGIAAGAAAVLATRANRRRQRAERFAAAALETLLRAIDANDSQTGAHVRRVARYALILADALGVDDAMRRTIELAALFHDIGKIHEALFDIVHEGRRLTASERRAIATHPRRGAEVLAPIAYFYEELAEAVLAHHERWDGQGYPRGIKGRRIPLAARVVTIADTFDAITHRRRYRDGRTAREAADILAAGRGTQFDPELADVLLLPPVFAQMARAHRFAMRPATLRHRSNDHSARKPPRVRIRWRTRTELPRSVRQKAAGT